MNCHHIWRSRATVNYGIWSESAEQCVGCGEVRHTTEGLLGKKPWTALLCQVIACSLKRGGQP